MAKKMIVNRLEMPKLPTAMQFGFSDELLSVDFCADSEIPPLEDKKTSFSTIILTQSTAKKLHAALTRFLASQDVETE